MPGQGFRLVGLVGLDPTKDLLMLLVDRLPVAIGANEHPQHAVAVGQPGQQLVLRGHDHAVVELAIGRAHGLVAVLLATLPDLLGQLAQVAEVRAAGVFTTQPRRQSFQDFTNLQGVQNNAQSPAR